MYAGVAGGATEILIPERPFDIGGVCERLKKRHEAGRYASIIVVAEGAEPAEGTMPALPKEEDEFGHVKLGGTAYRVASEIEKRTGFDTRVVVIGHVQRGGSPSAYDRVLASRFGVAAADAVNDHDWGQMVALKDHQIVRVPIAEAVSKLKVVPDEFVEQFGSGFFGG
jgi:6-phosphofructokinase 1